MCCIFVDGSTIALSFCKYTTVLLIDLLISTLCVMTRVDNISLVLGTNIGTGHWCEVGRVGHDLLIVIIVFGMLQFDLVL